MHNNVSRIGVALTLKGGSRQSTGSSKNKALYFLEVRARAALEDYCQALEALPSNSPEKLTLDTPDKSNKPPQKKD